MTELEAALVTFFLMVVYFFIPLLVITAIHENFPAIERYLNKRNRKKKILSKVHYTWKS